MTKKIERLLQNMLNQYRINKVGAILEKGSNIKIVQILPDGEMIELK
mgnify:FL=1